MTSVFAKHRITAFWLLLVGATLISWELGHGIGISDVHMASAVVIAIAFIKVRMVAFEFMELRHAPLFMRIASDAWVAIMCVVLVTLYLMPR